MLVAFGLSIASLQPLARAQSPAVQTSPAPPFDAAISTAAGLPRLRGFLISRRGQVIVERQRGQLSGRQIVPADWVAASFVPRTRSHWSDQLFRYGWWIRQMAGRPVYYAWGYGGQFIFVVPDLELVVVTTSATTPGGERHDHLRAVYDVVERLVIGPTASDHALAAGARSAR